MTQNTYNSFNYTANPTQSTIPSTTTRIMTNRMVPNSTGIVGMKKVFIEQQVTFVGGESFGCENPHHQHIPLIRFNPDCSKCHGTGAHKSMFSKSAYPCHRCYSHAGYCAECYGTTIQYKTGKLCGNCKEGKRLKR